MGLINQVIERAPRWLIRKLTSTYVTLGLSDIAKEVGCASEDEVRATIVSMVSVFIPTATSLNMNRIPKYNPPDFIICSLLL